ncbi:unnamed protein product [Gongylonema pulchrum]|uniref:Ovule protein n=1 Tax=Gongylonema pulchrum TaxID=637853 RepID=A0A183EZ78_9BILA|nr:unnamed protein product [Gongylonema pulchrum]
MSLSSTPFSHQGYSSDVSSSECYYPLDSNESEYLEHYESNLEKYKEIVSLFFTFVIFLLKKSTAFI